MANSPQARKRAKQTVTRRARNVAMGSMLRTKIKKVYYAVAAGDKATAEAAFKDAVPVIDRMARKGLIHNNKAARHKSRLNQHINGMQAS